ncbi:hypothetical protein CR513_42199, partial [Mucuna pruriens]
MTEGLANKPLKEYVSLTILGLPIGIACPVIEDPNDHLKGFLEIGETKIFQGITPDALYLHLFSLTPRDKVKAWIRIIPIDVKMTLHFKTGGIFMDKSLEKAIAIIEVMASN